MMMMPDLCFSRCLWIGLSLLGFFAAASAEISAQQPINHPSVLSSEFLYGEVAFPQCHASTIAEGSQGLVAAWFGGTREKHPDVGIWVAYQDQGGWSTPVEVANGVQYRLPDGTEHRHPCWNPVLFQPRDGDLMLFYKVGPDPKTWWGMLMTSADGGRSWTTPQRLPEGIWGPIKNKPIELAEGTILWGAGIEFEGWKLHFEWTNDLGKTWQRTPGVHDGTTIAAIQASLLQTGNNELLAIGRTRQQRLFQIRSTDAGRSWGEMTLTEVPNPNSGTDAVTLKSGQHLLVYNPVEKGRSPLSLAVSEDGQQWQRVLDFETEPGEYSYPALIQTADGRVHVTYTWKRTNVRHVTLDPQQFVGGNR